MLELIWWIGYSFIYCCKPYNKWDALTSVSNSFQLCATKKGREYLRSKSSYFILRELYNVESDKNVKLACENVIDILIKKEEEINVDNYHEHEVPEDVIPKLIEMDENYLKN